MDSARSKAAPEGGLYKSIYSQEKIDAANIESMVKNNM